MKSTLPLALSVSLGAVQPLQTIAAPAPLPDGPTDNGNGPSDGATQNINAPGGYVLVAGLIASGGGGTSGGGYNLTGTIGQWEANATATGAEGVFGGFWGTDGAPRLQITRAGTSVHITWSASLTGFRLQQSPAVAGPQVSWANVAESVTSVNGENQVTLGNLTGSRFFRLNRP